jgi:hypothetical protein
MPNSMPPDTLAMMFSLFIRLQCKSSTGLLRAQYQLRARVRI